MSRAEEAAAGASAADLPPWAVVTAARRAHTNRVTALLDAWALALGIPTEEARAWHDAGRWHDALRDAPETDLRRLVDDPATPVPLLHGPAAARRLAADGESRDDVLDAIRWHTTGRPGWSRTGRALYMADFLEPGRTFDADSRAALAARATADFEGTFREVVRARLIWCLREGRALHPGQVALWDEVRR